MRLRYEVTMNDILALQDFHFTHSPTLKRVVNNYRWGGAILIALLCLSAKNYSLAYNLFSGCVVAGSYFLICPTLFRRSSRKQAMKMHSEGKNRGFLGEHELEILEDGIVERTPYNETKTAWGAVERIEATSEHTFIYVGPLMAHVIPHNDIIEGDYREFLTQLRQHFKPDQSLNSGVAS